MSWAIGYDRKWKRDIGYGVPAYCDYPGCTAEIHRGLSYVCGGEPFGGEYGCGLYFCSEHLHLVGEGEHPDMINDECAPLCDCCIEGEGLFKPNVDHPTWIRHKLTDESWQRWRDENPDEVLFNTILLGLLVG